MYMYRYIQVHVQVYTGTCTGIYRFMYRYIQIHVQVSRSGLLTYTFCVYLVTDPIK